MNWSQIINDLLGVGLSQTQIAERIPCGQGYISDLRNEKKGLRVSYEKGSALIRLHDEYFPKERVS